MPAVSSAPSIEEQLGELPLDDFSRLVVHGALRVIADRQNPIRLHLFAAAIRELFGHTLHRLAPDDEVKACSWFSFEKGQNKPTRRQRAKYATQGGLGDRFISAAGVDVEHLHDAAIDAVNELSNYTHVQEGSVVSDSAEIDAFVEKAFGALLGLFESFAECRSKIQEAIFSHVHEETISGALSETIQSLDEIATHHSVEYVWVDEVQVERITHDTVHFVVRGSVEAEMQWGSNSDVRRGDGAEMDLSFPFRATMWSFAEDITDFHDTEVVVDTRSWWENYDDKGDY
ncbi:MAG TPA: hypothetical protein VMF69_27930 [Gemmataceae bacterium]|nr:hypothetical protein [Gemmataceae bacterium]